MKREDAWIWKANEKRVGEWTLYFGEAVRKSRK